MSMEAAGGGTGTIIPPYYDRRLGGDDGSGDARDWEEWEAGMTTRDMGQTPDLSRPEGGRAADFRHNTPLRLGGMSLGIFTPNAAMDRGRIVASLPPYLGRAAIPPLRES